MRYFFQNYKVDIRPSKHAPNGLKGRFTSWAFEASTDEERDEKISECLIMLSDTYDNVQVATTYEVSKEKYYGSQFECK